MATKRSSLENWNRRLLRSQPPRSKSLIITLFGDSLLPCVPSLWLSELIELLRPFHVNAQLARTSCFRLAEEGWLQSQREGRSSRYSLTPSGQQRVEHAYHRIYDPPAKEWDGNWTIVIPGEKGSSAAARGELRRELEWEGFGRLAGKLFIHPRPNLRTLHEVLERLALAGETIALRGRDLEGFSSHSAAALTAECWDLGHVGEHYRSFLQQFKPVPALLQPEPEPEAAFVLQTLLIHFFRRVVLHDPRLPAALLPAAWPGHAAYDLCRDIYRKTYKQTGVYLAQHLGEIQSRALKPEPDFLHRWGIDIGSAK